VIWFFVGVAQYRAMRFRLAHTRWRGIRFSLEGPSFSYGLKSSLLAVLVVLTIGIAAPYRKWVLYKHQMSRLYIGDKAFSVEGRPRGIIGLWVLALILTVPTLGFAYAVYKCYELKKFIAVTRFDGVEMQVQVSAWDMVKVYWPMLPFALALTGLYIWQVDILIAFEPESAWGLVLPYLVMLVGGAAIWTIARVIVLHGLAKLVCARLRVFGGIQPEKIEQTDAPTPRFGEGLADALDIGGL